MPADQSSHSQGSWSAWSECRRHWRAYVLAWAVAIAAAFVICAGIPNTYSAQVKIADEHKESDLLLGLNAFASWAKGAINERQGVRLPDVYYRLVTSPSFIDEMKRVRVKGYGTDYYHYILRHHKPSWWQQFAKAFSSDTLTEEERVTEIIRGSIRSKVSSKYGTIVLQVTDQDPLVAAMLVDSVRQHLQHRLVEHSRLRAFRDLMTASSKMEQAKQRYEKARDEYTRFADTHADLTSPKASSMEDHLLKEYEHTFESYSRECEQYIRAKAIVDKFSFKFAVLKNATVPHQSAGPSTFGYSLAFLFLATVFVSWWALGLRKYKEYKTKA